MKPRIGILNVNGSRYATIRSANLVWDILDAKPEQRRSAKEIILAHAGDEELRARQIADRAARLVLIAQA